MLLHSGLRISLISFKFKKIRNIYSSWFCHCYLTIQPGIGFSVTQRLCVFKLIIWYDWTTNYLSNPRSPFWPKTYDWSQNIRSQNIGSIYGPVRKISRISTIFSLLIDSFSILHYVSSLVELKVRKVSI